MKDVGKSFVINISESFQKERCYTSISCPSFSHIFCKSIIESVGPHVGSIWSIVNLLILCMDKRWAKDGNQTFLF